MPDDGMLTVAGEPFEVRRVEGGWQARSLHPRSPRRWCKARSLAFALIRARKAPESFSASPESFGDAAHRAEVEMRDAR